VQGVFQGMIAHEVLICGLPTPAANGLRFEWLASYPSPDDLVRELCRAQDGLLYRLISLWLQGGRVPLVLQAAPSGSRTAGKGSLADELRDLDLSNCVAHGLPSLEGQLAGFFAFFRLPTEPGSHELRMLELLLPYLHAAWLRANFDMATQGSVQTVAAREILIARGRDPALGGARQEQERDRVDPQHQPSHGQESRAEDPAQAQRAERRAGGREGHQPQSHAPGRRRALLRAGETSTSQAVQPGHAVCLDGTRLHVPRHAVPRHRYGHRAGVDRGRMDDRRAA